MALTIRSLPSGRARLRYLTVGSYGNVIFIEYEDGRIFRLGDLPQLECPSVVTDESYIDDSNIISIGGDNSFYHVDTKLSIDYNASLEQLKYYDTHEESSFVKRVYYIPDKEAYSLSEYLPSSYSYTRRSWRYVFERTPHMYRYFSENIYTGEIGQSRFIYVSWLDEVTAQAITIVNGGDPTVTVHTLNPGSNRAWGEVPSWTSLALQHQVSNLVLELQRIGRQELPALVPRDAAWKASLKAADGVKAYDLNMVEAFLNFGLDDIIPKKLSTKSLGLLKDACRSQNPFVWMMRLTQISASMYLHYKYVIATNASDLAQITGLDLDVCQTLQDCSKSFHKDGVDEAEINQQLYHVARRISFAERFYSSTYGAVTSRTALPIGDAYIKVNARLRAYPGEYADISALGIITDEFGLRFTATRGVAAIPWEFVANWFLPIEELVHSIEYNDAHLNVLFDVQSLCQSESVILTLGHSFKELYGLTNAEVEGRVRYYNRTVSDHFPPTELSFSKDHGAINSSKVLQGGSLIITR